MATPTAMGRQYRTRARASRGIQSERVSAQAELEWSDSPAIEDFSDDSDGMVRKISHSKSIRKRKMPMFFEQQSGTSRPWMHGALPAKPRNPAEEPTTQLAAQEEVTNLEDESSLMDPSLLSLGSLDSSSPAHGTRPPSAIKIGGTPAHESSFLALKKFKRRAREPSLLDAIDKLASLDKTANQTQELKNRRRGTSTPSTGSAGKKRKLSSPDIQVPQSYSPTPGRSGTNTPSTSSSGKKRKLSSPDIQVPQSSPPVASRSGTSTPSVASSSKRRKLSSPVSQDPQSSSPLVAGSGTATPSRPSPANKSRLSSPITRDPESSPQGTPVKATGPEKRGRLRRGSPTGPLAVSTTKLQALLPKRRLRPQKHEKYNDDDDDESQESQQSDDEWEVRSPINKAKEGRRTREATATEDTSRAAGPSGGKPDPKLASIAKKFEDVDAYDMEFETVDVGGGSSSPWR